MNLLKRMLLAGLAVSFGLSAGMSRSVAEESESADWEKPFNGKTLDGWEVLEGNGNFFVEHGEIVGETAVGVKNSYLCTKKTYDNFEFELEFKVAQGNSLADFKAVLFGF